jgi:PqqD family protein of HPr-rel-A system
MPRQRAGVLELDMGDGVILYDDRSSLVHHLNPSASVVWKLCRGEATLGEIAVDVARGYALERSEAEAHVAAAVSDFRSLGLVEDVRLGIPEAFGKPGDTS